MLLRKLPALAVILCLLACEALAGGMSGCACCTARARPCCPAMAGEAGIAGGTGGGMGTSCPKHKADLRASFCSMRPAGQEVAILHVHPELQPRPAVVPRADDACRPRLAARLPEPACQRPASPAERPETPPPRLLTAA